MTATAPEGGARTVAERKAAGREARRATPRSSHAEWDRTGDVDPVAIVLGEDAGRVPELVPIRHARMGLSPFAFFRGAAAIMAADLASTPASGLTVQACGDAHLANFGVFAAPDRRLVFDLNDFDETLRAPWEWDVKRLVASLAIAGRHRGFDEELRCQVVAEAAAAYREAMWSLAERRDLDVWYARKEIDSLADAAPELSPAARDKVRKQMARAKRKDSLRALKRLTVETEDGPRLISDPPLLVPAHELAPGLPGEEIIARIAELLDRYRATVPDEIAHLLGGYRLVDVARKVVGVGSVGTRCWVLLLLGRDERDPLVLQAKEAGPSVLAPHAAPSPYDHQGRRVVEGQRLMQATGDILLGWVRATDGEGGVHRDFYVRQLWDAKASADVEAMEPTDMEHYGRLCAETLARAHARSGDRIAIAAYLGRRRRFDKAMTAFAEAYAEQNDRDFGAFCRAVAAGRVSADPAVA
jgi:uncharacterized protein (DUF2252 family)